MAYTMYFCINHKKEISSKLKESKEYGTDLSYFNNLGNNRSKEEQILDDLNLPFKIRISKENKPNVKLPYWTSAIFSVFKLINRLNFSDQSDHVQKRDKLIDELIRNSSFINEDLEDLDYRGKKCNIDH